MHLTLLLLTQLGYDLPSLAERLSACPITVNFGSTMGSFMAPKCLVSFGSIMGGSGVQETAAYIGLTTTGFGGQREGVNSGSTTGGFGDRATSAFRGLINFSFTSLRSPIHTRDAVEVPIHGKLKMFCGPAFYWPTIAINGHSDWLLSADQKRALLFIKGNDCRR